MLSIQVRYLLNMLKICIVYYLINLRIRCTFVRYSLKIEFALGDIFRSDQTLTTGKMNGQNYGEFF